MAEQVVLFLLMSLASYRLWRLIGYDTISEPLRDKIKPDSWLDALVTCQWCLGSWISFAVVAATAWVGDVNWPVWQALGVSVVVGWLHGTLETTETFDVHMEHDD